MKIQNVKIYQIEFPLENAILFGPNKSYSRFDGTVVEVETDSGLTGVGEVCPLDSAYLPAFTKGIREELQQLASEMIGENPLELKKINEHMDYLHKGHPFVKSAIDIACWDILGKATGLPLCTLMGGRFGDSVPLYKAISQSPPHEIVDNVLHYKKMGYTKFQLKIGGNVDRDIEGIRRVRQALDPVDVVICDANCGYQSHEAIRLANAVKDLDVYIEQPCLTYQECLRIRKRSNLPFILDESADSIEMLTKIHIDNAADMVALKIGKWGGLTKALQTRDLCVSYGIPMKIEDSGGTDIITAAISHLAHSTPEPYRFLSYNFSSCNKIQLANGSPSPNDISTFRASDKPGLGVTLRYDVLGKPVFEV